MQHGLKVTVSPATDKGFYVIAKAGNEILHAEYHNARTTANKIASAMRKGIELGVTQSAITNSEPVKPQVTEETVREFLQQFWDAGWWLGMELDVCTFRRVSLGIKKQASSWYNLLSYLVDKEDAVEVAWCKDKGIKL